MTGALIYVMGPSGAGKDSVLARARALLPGEAPIVFAHRYITRPADSGGENHIALSPEEFAIRRRRGLFAYHWRAHGNDYGIGREIHEWRQAGMAVVVSGSREHFHGYFQKTGGLDAQALPVLITASTQRLQARLAGRGRENEAQAAARLDRAEAYAIDDPRLVTIVNDGVLDEAAQRFADLLAALMPPARPVCSTDGRPPA